MPEAIRIECPRCGKDVALTQTGRIWPHGDLVGHWRCERAGTSPTDVTDEEQIASLASIADALMIATSNLTADVETRARAMAQPRIDEIQRTAAQRVLEAERDRDFQIQRKDDVLDELRRQLKSLDQQRDRLYAQVKRVDTLWRSLPINGEFEQQLRAALHPVEAETDHG